MNVCIKGLPKFRPTAWDVVCLSKHSVFVEKDTRRYLLRHSRPRMPSTPADASWTRLQLSALPVGASVM